MRHAPIDRWPHAERELYVTVPLYGLWTKTLQPFVGFEAAMNAEIEQLGTRPMAAWRSVRPWS